MAETRPGGVRFTTARPKKGAQVAKPVIGAGLPDSDLASTISKGDSPNLCVHFALKNPYEK